MGIEEIFTSLKSDCKLSSKIATKTEEKNIEKLADNIISEILQRIKDKADYINNGLSYNCTAARTPLSPEEKQRLFKKLEESAKQLPAKLKQEIDYIFGAGTTEETDSSKQQEADKEETEQEQSAATQVAVQLPKVNQMFPSFGY